MPSVVHIVTTGSLAGAERYVCDVATETASRGWKVAVVGGDAVQMRQALGIDVRWGRGSTPMGALGSLAKLGRHDICHAHMTLAEAVALAARPFHRAPVVSTRHFAAHRGSTRFGRLLAPWIGARLARQIAVSDFVADHLERPPDAIIRCGVRSFPFLWRPENRVVLVLQRLEPEKDTWTALQAWQLSEMADKGWRLRIVGDGSERRRLEEAARGDQFPSVELAGWQADVAAEFARAGVLLATAPAEPFGLAVAEAMAAGVPVVASAAGGHLETVGGLPGARLFPPGDAGAAAAALRSLLADAARAEQSAAGRALAASSFTIAGHVDALLREYGLAMRAGETDFGTTAKAAR